MRNLARIITISSVAILAMTSLSAAAEKPPYQKTVIYNMFPTPEVKPARYFLTANSGPYLRNLKWKGWGTAKAAGKGRFISDCASCGPKENKRVRITFFKKKPCHKRKVMTYSFVKIKVIDPERPNRVRKDPMPCL